MLSPLGLSTEHEAVYRCMLTHPDLNVAGLARKLDISVDEVRGALDVLAALALVRLDADNQHARPVRPQAGLGVLLAKVEAEIAERQRQIEAARATIVSIATAYEEKEQVAEGQRLEGLDAVRDRLVELSLSACEECVSFSPGGGQSPDTIESEQPLNGAALARGVMIRNVYQDSVRNDLPTLAYATWMASQGGQSRTVPTLPLRMVVVDRKTALVPLNPDRPRDGALELRSPGVVAGLMALFEQIWQTGTPFGDVSPVDSHGLSPQERELLQLLALGHTDESAARQLAVSTRSVQRMTNALTKRLGARSRFEAGVLASRQGWV